MTLTEVVVKGWRRENYKYRTKMTGKIILVTCESDSQAANIFEELNSTQKEAGYRRVPHEAQLDRLDYKSVVVASEDTDIFLLPA